MNISLNWLLKLLGKTIKSVKSNSALFLLVESRTNPETIEEVSNGMVIEGGQLRNFCGVPKLTRMYFGVSNSTHGIERLSK